MKYFFRGEEKRCCSIKGYIDENQIEKVVLKERNEEWSKANCKQQIHVHTLLRCCLSVT